MRRWAHATHDMRCGFDWCLIPVGDPVQLIETSREVEPAPVSRSGFTPIGTAGRLPLDWKSKAAGE